MGNEQKKSDNHSRIYIIIIAVVLCACAYSAVRSCGPEGNSNIRTRADEVRSGIEHSADSNTKLQEQLGNAGGTAVEIEGSLGTSAGAIGEAENTAGAIADDLDRAEAAIRNCQSIVNGIKRRNAERTPET